MAQVSFFSIINILGSPPDLLLGAVVALAMLESDRICIVGGIIAGFLYCALGGFSYPLYILFSFFCACVLSYICKRFPKRNYPAFLALAMLAYCAKAAFNFAELIIFSHASGLFHTLIYAVVPEFISSVIFCSISYLVMSRTVRALNKNAK